MSKISLKNVLLSLIFFLSLFLSFNIPENHIWSLKENVILWLTPFVAYGKVQFKREPFKHVIFI